MDGECMNKVMTVDKTHKRNSISILLRSFRTQRELWLLCIPIIIWVLVFSYYPMYGVLMAFFNYVPGKEIWQCEFVGLKWFIDFFSKPAFIQLLRNTLAMSMLGIVFGFPAPIIFALLLNEIGNVRVKKVFQTISYLPHFISWVVAASMVYMLLSNEGIVNNLLIHLGFFENTVPFLSKGEYYWAMYTIVNIWKGVGWSSIIYLSAIAGIDEQLYQAGAIDGLGRFGMIKHITIPSIAPTIVLLWILGIGGILNAGFEQHLLLGNPMTQKYWDVIDTYSYRFGVQQGFYSMGTAVGLFKSVIGFSLVIATNKLSKKIFDLSII
jgi:putative aldouronate transport system permease protein